jgi:NAD(P)H-hydrate epimerase
MKLVTADQMRAIEQSCVEAGISLDELMENAGLAVANAVKAGFDDDGGRIYGKRIMILIGAGNNGADGFVAGRHLADWAASVTALLCLSRGYPDQKRDLAQDAGAESFQHRMEFTDLVIDAILGIGASRPIGTTLAWLLSAYANSGVPVVALDLPTGLNSDTGEFDPAGLPADQTLQLGYPKLGPALTGDSYVTGEIEVLDIGIPFGFDSQVNTTLLTDDFTTFVHPLRPTDGHKGTFGSTLIIGGSQDYLGAVTMATDAAGRSGVGLTFVATPEPAYNQIAGNIPEEMYRSLPVSANGNVDPSGAARIALELAARSTSAVIGPGLGNNENTAEFLTIALSQLDPATPFVLDADALNILSKSHQWRDRFESPAVLTPHPGEMSRLGISTQEVQQDRKTSALEAANKFNRVVVLKG